MPPRSRAFDDVSRLFRDVAGMAEGVRHEAEAAVRARIDQFLASMDVVGREEFEAVRAMAVAARTENERLERRIAALEARLAATTPPGTLDPTP